MVEGVSRDQEGRDAASIQWFRGERGALPAELLAHEQQIHLSKAKMGCRHAPGAQFLAKKRMGTPCVACRVLLCATPLGPA